MTRRLLGLFLVLLFPVGSYAETPAEGLDHEPASLLVQMSEAVRRTTYSGIVVYSSESRMETLSILHEYRDGAVRERLTSMTGDAREIYRTNDEVICVIPEQKLITVDQRGHQAASLLPSLRSDQLDSLEDRYRFEDMGTRRVAGRQCRGVRILPRDDMRYGYEYWLDTETHLPLRLSVLDADGRSIEQMMFTSVSFPERFDDARFQRDASSDGYRIIRHADETPRLRVPARWSVSNTPPGFRKIAHSVRQGADDRVPVEHFLFSDGLATISVYGANAPDETSVIPLAPEDAQTAQRQAHMGALNVVSRIIDGHSVTVVGEVPVATVQWLADHLELAPSIDGGPAQVGDALLQDVEPQ